MIETVPFNPVHLEHIDLTKAQEYAKDFFEAEQYLALLMNNTSYTAIKDGKILGAGGVYEVGPHIVRAWALFSTGSYKYLPEITELVKGYLEARLQDYPRIETMVRSDYGVGKRWLKQLGFKNETPHGMANFGFDGEAYDLWSLTHDYQNSGRA